MVRQSMGLENEGSIYIPDIEDAVKKILDETPGFASLAWNYRNSVAKFVVNDVWGKSTKERAYLQTPAAFYFVGQALKKLPLMCVIDQVYFDRFVSHIVQRAVNITKAEDVKRAENAAKAAEKKKEEAAKKPLSGTSGTGAQHTGFKQHGYGNGYYGTQGQRVG